MDEACPVERSFTDDLQGALFLDHQATLHQTARPEELEHSLVHRCLPPHISWAYSLFKPFVTGIKEKKRRLINIIDETKPKKKATAMEELRHLQIEAEKVWEKLHQQEQAQRKQGLCQDS